jgi:hypothetical protein
MGFRDFFRRRRDRESAFGAAELERLERAEATGQPSSAAGQAESGRADTATSGAGAGPAEELELPGGTPAELGEMIARAISSGQAQISTESHVLDMRGSGLRDEILGLLAGRGVDPIREGQVNLDGSSGTGQELLELLRRHGIDPSAGGEPAEPPDDRSDRG